MDLAFHTAFPPLDGTMPGDSIDRAPDVLRPLEWSVLCARLVAIRDFHAARLAEIGSEPPAASFHGSAAQWLAALGTRRAPAGPGREDEALVNPNPSGDGKAASVKTVPDAASAPCATGASVEFEKRA